MRVVTDDYSATFGDISCQSEELQLADYDWALCVEEHTVFSLLTRLSVKKVAGPEGIPPRIYKEMAEILAKPLLIIFNTSLREKVVPKQWKHGTIIPVPKSNPPDVSKLRYLTLLSVPAKILEAIVINNARHRLMKTYGDGQHGFRRQHSTTTALIDIVDSVSLMIDDKINFGAALLSFDLTRAFDLVNRNLLINRLRVNDFPCGLLTWIQNYLK